MLPKHSIGTLQESVDSQRADKWYEYMPEVLDNGYKILWDFNIQTDHGIMKQEDLILL